MGRPEAASPGSERSPLSANAPRSFGGARPGADLPEARAREAAWPAPAADGWKNPASPAAMPQQQQQPPPQPGTAIDVHAIAGSGPSSHSAGSRSPSPAHQVHVLQHAASALYGTSLTWLC